MGAEQTSFFFFCEFTRFSGQTDDGFCGTIGAAVTSVKSAESSYQKKNHIFSFWA
jgi:hypothetical protein